MFLIKSPVLYDPKINLAVEEFSVRNLSMDCEYLFIYQNAPAVIIGKNQNPYEEVNLSYIFRNEIELCRRISGGGAVYHDQGNINFCYITKNTRENFNQYQNFLNPVVKCLNGLGVNAQINKRNDLVIAGKKISGNAQFTSRQRLLSHGTLLFDTNPGTIKKSLQPASLVINSRSTKSIRSPVTNIADNLKVEMTPQTFLDAVKESIFNYFSFEGEIIFNKDQWTQILSLADEKYASWDWTWGRTPGFRLEVFFNGKKQPDAQFYIENGIIKNIDIWRENSITKGLNSLVGIRYQRSEIENYFVKTGDKRKQKLIADGMFSF
jgi:lipoate-protein ligase A